jgi:hypothetical protein
MKTNTRLTYVVDNGTLLLQKMPNALRRIARGFPLYSSFINMTSDDVSGNRSKSYNKHWNIYVEHANLPRSLLHQEFHQHFLSTSQHATVPEQLEGLKEMLECVLCDCSLFRLTSHYVSATHKNPIQVYDAVSGKTALVRIFIHAEPGDNPMQDTLTSHISGNSSYNCRKCMSGGTQEVRTSADGYHSLFSVRIHL